MKKYLHLTIIGMSCLPIAAMATDQDDFNTPTKGVSTPNSKTMTPMVSTDERLKQYERSGKYNGLSPYRKIVMKSIDHDDVHERNQRKRKLLEEKRQQTEREKKYQASIEKLRKDNEAEIQDLKNRLATYAQQQVNQTQLQEELQELRKQKTVAEQTVTNLTESRKAVTDMLTAKTKRMGQQLEQSAQEKARHKREAQELKIQLRMEESKVQHLQAKIELFEATLSLKGSKDSTSQTNGTENPSKEEKDEKPNRVKVSQKNGTPRKSGSSKTPGEKPEQTKEVSDDDDDLLDSLVNTKITRDK